MVCWPDCEHSTRGVVPDFGISEGYDVVHAAPGTTEKIMLDALMQALDGVDMELPEDSIYRFRVRTDTLGNDLQIRVDSVIWGVNWAGVCNRLLPSFTLTDRLPLHQRYPQLLLRFF